MPRSRASNYSDVRPNPDAAAIQELAGPRNLTRWQGALLFIIALWWSIFQLSLGSVLILNSTVIRSVHLAFAFTIVFLSYPLLRKPSRIGILSALTNRSRFYGFELLIALIAAAAALYIIIDYVGIAERIGTPIPRDRVIGILLFALLLEAARRVVGPALPVLALLFSLYAFFGRHMPSIIAFQGVSLDRFLGQISMSTEGIYGVPLGVSANIVFLFVLFGSMLEKAGGGAYFIRLSTALLGGFRGGPAKAAILSSGLTGMVNGSSIANVVTTGTFTIPLMKSVGYPPKKAAAIEVAASVGGQLMPPIMGAAAFIMAEYVNLPYIEVVKAAFLPAFVAYSALFYISHLEACKLNLRGLPRAELPQFGPTFLSGVHYLIPIGVLIYKLVVLRHTPESSAFLAVMFLAALIIIQETWRGRKAGISPLNAVWRGVKLLAESLAAGARNNVTVAIACASAGIIVGIVTMGPGGMLTEAVAYLSAGNIYVLLLITAFACIVLGMGLPTTANYIVMASLTAPIIVQVGESIGLLVPLVAAHMFVFYFGILADDTPPVGLAAYAAAAIAKSNPIPTGVQGFIYDIRTAVLPFMFIFNTELLLWGVTSVIHGVFLFVTAALGGLAFASATQGWFIARSRWYEILAMLIVTLIIFQPTLPPRLIGIEVDYRLRGQDIERPVEYLDNLRDSEMPLSQSLYARMSVKTLKVLEEARPSDGLVDSLAFLIAQDLNKRLAAGALYRAENFQGVKLTDQTARLLSQNPVGARLFRLNRMLLHDAYPESVHLSRLTSLERRLGFHPKYFSFILAFGLWGLVWTGQRRRVRSAA